MLNQRYIFSNPTAEFSYNAIAERDLTKYLQDETLRNKSRSKKINTIKAIQKKWKLTDNALMTIKSILPGLEPTYWKRKATPIQRKTEGI